MVWATLPLTEQSYPKVGKPLLGMGKQKSMMNRWAQVEEADLAPIRNYLLRSFERF